MIKKESLKEGQKLDTIFFVDGEDITTMNGTEITVVMEYGQMAGVPWADVREIDGCVCRWNLALCLGVRLIEDKDNE
jgi:hypothetical protein